MRNTQREQHSRSGRHGGPANARLRDAATLVRGAVSRVAMWFDPPLGPDSRPLEVREAILEEVESRLEPAGSGRRVLPFNQVTATIVTVDREQRARFEATLGDLKRAVVTRLTELKCDAPAGLAVRVDYAKRPRAGWPAGRWLDVEFSRSASGVHSEAVTPTLHVTVARGSSDQPSYSFTDHEILIGRASDPVDQRGRTRHNQIAFLEGGDAAARTVGRAHASIRYEPDRRHYRLFDEGSHNGTRIVRHGAVLELPARDPVGVVLQSGDEIRFGTASIMIRFEIPSEVTV